ncbi:MAG TPA: HAD family hydrolase, partial [Saliniramus sp.]|nr:HAD family hydrolase [Saliniramus sp.]
MTLKAILFDKDGTLIDFDATWGPAAYAVMRELADGDAHALQLLVEVSEYIEEERRFLPSSPLVAGSSAHYGPLWAEILGRESGREFFGLMDDLFRVHGLASLSPIGDPAAVMRALAKRRLHLGIATNDSEASARAQAQALGIDGFMSYFAGYDSGHGSKPEPGMVTAFATAHELHPAQIAMVGDSLHDLHSARAAGARTITVLSGPRGEAARAELEPFSDHMLGSIL